MNIEEMSTHNLVKLYTLIVETPGDTEWRELRSYISKIVDRRQHGSQAEDEVKLDGNSKN